MPDRRNPSGGGAAIGLLGLAGALVGVRWGEASLGLVLGLGVGAAIALGLWLWERR